MKPPKPVECVYCHKKTHLPRKWIPLVNKRQNNRYAIACESCWSDMFKRKMIGAAWERLW